MLKNYKFYSISYVGTRSIAFVAKYCKNHQ